MTQEDTNPRTAVSGAVVSTPKGGTIEVPSDKRVATPAGGALTTGPYGIAFGPLDLTAYPKSTVTITKITYGAGEDSGGWFGGGSSDGWFAALPFAAAVGTRDEDSSLTRRDVLRGLAGLGGTAALASTARGATTATRAEVQVAKNPAGLRVRVLDRVANLLPTDAVYGLTVNAIKYDSFNAGRDGYGDLPPTLTGTVAVAQDVSALAFFKALSGAKAVKYSGLELPKAPTKVATGTKLEVTNHDILVRHVQKAGGDDATLEIGGTSIPHYSESKNSKVGWWAVRDDAVVYQSGPDPPASTKATLRIYAGPITETKDDASRVV